MICEDKKTNDNWKKNYNFTLNINYLADDSVRLYI